MNQTDFSSLKLQPALFKNLSSLGYHEMTAIQAQSLPPILEGDDVIAQGKTGSGKTVAFSLGLLEKIDLKLFRENYCVQSLVICPTRELADQVAKEIRKLARAIENIKVLTLCGGMLVRPQTTSLEHGVHIVVGTPGRIEKHLRKGTLTLEGITTLVLDEADRMLEMGFQPSLDFIIEQMPVERQTLLFSATFPSQIKSISKRIMKQPVVVKVAEIHDSSSIHQNFYPLGDTSRTTALRLLLLEFRPESALVFCNTKLETQQVADTLCDGGFSALALHGDLEQRERDQVLVQFANKSISILIATDVAARGLDIDSLSAVFNYHVAHDADLHIHRIGRTGRAGSQGMACTLFDEQEQYKIERLEVTLEQHIKKSTLPPIGLLVSPTYKAPMATLRIDGGKKQKVRAGDILGALTGENGIAGKQVGKIQLFDNCAYVAIDREVANHALTKLSLGKLKGRSFRVWQV